MHVCPHVDACTHARVWADLMPEMSTVGCECLESWLCTSLGPKFAPMIVRGAPPTAESDAGLSELIVGGERYLGNPKRTWGHAKTGMRVWNIVGNMVSCAV